MVPRVRMRKAADSKRLSAAGCLPPIFAHSAIPRRIAHRSISRDTGRKSHIRSLSDLGLISATAPCVALGPCSRQGLYLVHPWTRTSCIHAVVLRRWESGPFFRSFSSHATAPPFASLFPQTIEKLASLSHLARYDRLSPTGS